MKVLLVLASSTGGVGRHVADLAAGLTEQGHTVSVAGPAAAQAAFGFPGADRLVVEIADRPRPLADLRATAVLRSAVAGHDVVHAHGLRAGAVSAVAVRVRGGVRPPLVVTVHNGPGAGRAAQVHALLERVVARGADRVLAVSRDLVERLDRLGAPGARLAVVPAPSLPPPARPPAATRSALGVPAGTALLVTVARLAPQKGVDVLVEALARLSALPTPGWQAVLAGEGPLAAALRRRVGELGVPLQLLGDRDDVADLLAAADVVVVPSRWEGQPLVVQEALRAGAPVVATDSGGTADVAGGAAVLVPPEDPGALAEALAVVLTDGTAVVELRRRARERAATLPDRADALRHVLTVYRELGALR